MLFSDTASVVTAAIVPQAAIPPPPIPPTMSSSPSASTVGLSDSEPSSPQAGFDSFSDKSATNNAILQEECPEPVNVVEVPDIQREETLTCVSPTEKDNAAFLPKATVNGMSGISAAPKRPRPSSKSSKKDKKKPSESKSSKQPPVKKPRPNSTRPRPVAKNVLKNLKVGTVGEMTESQTIGDSKVLRCIFNNKVSIEK